VSDDELDDEPPTLLDRPVWRGPLRVAFDAAAGDAPDTLVLVGRMLADRLDEQRATGRYRGLVPLSAEFRALLRDLRETSNVGSDPIEQLIAEFERADADSAAAGDSADAGPAH
jgi:hypothetical protein